jgi:hypothetical protein
MVQLCHSNNFGSLYFCSQFNIRVLALLFAFKLVTESSTNNGTNRVVRADAMNH